MGYAIRMAEYDLRRLPEDDFVLHFGGRPNEVDAFTFSNSLIAISEALQEINRQINPEFGLEVAIEGVGPGSFRTKVRATLKSLGGLFKEHSAHLVIDLLAALIIHKMFTAEPTIIVSDDLVVIESGPDRIIIPKNVAEAIERLPNRVQAERHIGRAFAAMEDDPSITEFGLLRHIDDPTPVVVVPRSSFPVLAEPEATEPSDKRKYRDGRTNVTVVRAILENTRRPWGFIWQGIRINAPIRDQTFFDKLARREYWFAQGDSLDVLLRVHQVKDDMSGAFLNKSYEILTVYGVRHIERQQRFPEH
jgi:hypothetical protein